MNFFLNGAYPEKLRTRKGVKEWFREACNCELLEVTFRDVVEEYDMLYKQMSGYKDQWESPAIKKEFQKALDKAEEWFVKPRELIMEKSEETNNINYKLDPDQPIFDYCTDIISQRTTVLKFLEQMIRHSFTHLYDAHLLHRVLTLKKENQFNKIILITGASHCRGVYVHLEICEEATCITGLYADEMFTTDHLEKLEMPLEELEAKEKSWCVIC